MEKLRTLVVLVVLAAACSCAEVKKGVKEEKRYNEVEEGRRSGEERRPLTRDASPLKPKLLPIRIEKESGNGKKTTEDILRHIGMSKVRSPANNHRKRLASQSRKSHNEKHLADSRVFVIKLPPNKYYYEPDGLQKAGQSGQTINRIPLDFKSNGKPGKIYHWNLPMVKKMMARKTGNPKLAKEHDANEVLKEGPVWPKEEQPLHYRRVSYYKPKKPSKQAFHKYFPGNGKPHSIYVIERSRKPQNRRIH